MERKFLLLGGDGFIGKNLQKSFLAQKIKFISRDYKDYDMTTGDSIYKMTVDMESVTDIIVLASAVGVKVFSEEPVKGFSISLSILHNVYDAILTASELFNKKYRVTWLSSSEIYGNTTPNTYITKDDPISFDQFKPRSLYAQIKILGESLFFDLFQKKKIKALNIVRPFNISGNEQRRGLVYEMVKSVILNDKIMYAEDTTRTITEVGYFCDNMIKMMMSNDSFIDIQNIADNNNSVYLKTIAECIIKVLKDMGKITKDPEISTLPFDKTIHYRHTGVLHTDITEHFYNEMYKIIGDILKNGTIC